MVKITKHTTNWEKSYITIQAMPTNCSALQEKAVKKGGIKRVEKKSSQTGYNCYNWFHNVHRLNWWGFKLRRTDNNTVSYCRKWCLQKEMSKREQGPLTKGGEREERALLQKSILSPEGLRDLGSRHKHSPKKVPWYCHVFGHYHDGNVMGFVEVHYSSKVNCF